MTLAVVLACVLLVISAATALPGEPVVACYVDRSEHRLFLRTNLSLCTYVILSSATVEEDSSFRSLVHDADVRCTSPTAMKARKPALKTLLGVEVRQSRLQLLRNPGVLDNFTASALKYLKEKNYDGLELTWVENAISDERARNTEDLTALLKALRDRIKGDPDPNGNKSLLLSVSLLDRSGDSRFHTDDGAWSQYVDFISVVPSNLECEDSQIDRMVRYLQDDGFELQKILIILPAFGWGSHHRPGRNFSGTEDVRQKAERIYGPGLMMAKQVCQAIRSGETELKTLANFEGVQSPGAEVSGLLQKGIGGVGVVVIDVDNFEDSLCLNLTESDKVILKSKVMSTHHALLFRGHHHRRHHHHELQQPSHNESVDSNSSSHHHHRNRAPGHHHHGHGHHGHDYRSHGHHGHGHRGHGHHGHGHHGHGQQGHGHRGHGQHGHGHHGHGLGN